MISDVLSEAIRDINRYLNDPEYQREMHGDELLNDVRGLVAQMDGLREKLDGPPPVRSH